MHAERSSGLMAFLEDLPDPRAHNTVHRLTDIVALAIIAVMADCDSWVDVADFCQAHEAMLGRHLPLPGGIPSHDTFDRLFERLDPVAFERVFQAFCQSLGDEPGPAEQPDPTPGSLHLAVDGKTARRSFASASEANPVHMVTAFAVGQKLVFGQLATDQKSNEITAIPKLLGMLDLKDAVVSVDAGGCQREIARVIREGGGDYLLQVKKNQPTLLRMAEEGFDEPEPVGRGFAPAERGHGRIELRSLETIDAVAAGVDPTRWPDARTLIRLRAVRDLDGEVSGQDRYYVTSLAGDDATGLLALCRDHWKVENQLHWCLDVGYREDGCRVRKGHGAQNLNRVRKIGMNLLRSAEPPKKNMSLRRRRKACVYDEAYLLRVLMMQP